MATIQSYQSSTFRTPIVVRRRKPKFQTRLPHYFFTGVKVIRNDLKSPFDFFLILLANRFNSAYYLLLNTGKWSGGETSKAIGYGCLGVVETRQIVGLRSSRGSCMPRWD
jgi:hypothetical protein